MAERMTADEMSAIVANLQAIAHELATQDNRCTDQPMFLVQRKQRQYGLDPDYAGNIAWLNAYCDSAEAEGWEAVGLEAHYAQTWEEPSGWTRTGYQDHWEFVTACFTEAGAKQYIRLDGHNLGETRIYAAGSYRNQEWRWARAFLGEGALALLRAIARGVEYRPGLPSVEQVRAHQERGGWWQVRCGNDLSVLRLRGDGQDEVFSDDWDDDDLDGPWEWRPCLPDGTPCAWPGEPDPWAVLEVLR